MAFPDKINSIGSEPRSTDRLGYLQTFKKKLPEDFIGATLNGVGSLVNNLPSKFNSAFTVGQGANIQGAFAD